MSLKRSIIATLALASLSPVTQAAELGTMISEGKGKFNFRGRHEYVDQDGIAESAAASTLRSRFTWTSADSYDFGLGLEVDHIAVLGSEKYNSTENGNTTYPVVADPEGLDLNQVYVKYKGEKAMVTFGRQRIVLDDQRFIGGVAWRQNEQTYDALRVTSKSLGKLKADYSYVWNVNRIFGPDDGAQPGDWYGGSHFLNLGYDLPEAGKITGYAYLLDFENANGPANSTSTVGVSYDGKYDKLGVHLSIARQSDWADSPLDYDATYFTFSGNYAFPGVKAEIGYELLGSDNGVSAFKTPLATLHKFQGWTDKFLGTPANGIEDKWLGLSGAVGKVKLAAAYHQFDSDEAGIDYGSEIDLVGTYPVNKQVTLQLKLADYQAESFASDTTKVWFSIIFNP